MDTDCRAPAGARNDILSPSPPAFMRGEGPEGARGEPAAPRSDFHRPWWGFPMTCLTIPNITPYRPYFSSTFRYISRLIGGYPQR